MREFTFYEGSSSDWDIVRNKMLDLIDQTGTDRHPLVVLFGGEWCPNCKAIRGLLESDASVNNVDAIAYYLKRDELVTTDENQDLSPIAFLAKRLNIEVMSLPLIIFFNTDGTFTSCGMTLSDKLFEKIKALK